MDTAGLPHSVSNCGRSSGLGRVPGSSRARPRRASEQAASRFAPCGHGRPHVGRSSCNAQPPARNREIQIISRQEKACGEVAMSCQLYKKALIQAAASVSSPPADLREHFDACAPCRAAFDREQILVASIDAGLQRITNAEVPPSFLPHLRVRLAQYAAMEREPVPAWVLVAASAALVFGVVIARNAQHT